MQWSLITIFQPINIELVNKQPTEKNALLLHKKIKMSLCLQKG